MKNTLLATAVGFATLVSEAPAENPATPLGLVPLPRSIRTSARAGETVKFGGDTRILFEAGAPGAREAATLAAETLADSGGPRVEPAAGGKAATAADAIVLRGKPGLAPEGYELRTGRGVSITASSPAGFFYGVQTLRQMLRPGNAGSPLTVPAGLEIRDEPRFRWRGLMVDCCRHFFTVGELKQVLDMMASLKLNTFHWHLTEDQAWRIEIRKYPELTEIGAWRDSVGFGLETTSTTRYRADGKYGGFYTRQDVRDIIAHAAARHITVVPEIELPGHSTAALCVYPELGCTGGPYTMPDRGGIFPEVYCAGNDKTIRFLEDVLDEVADLFPSQYIHVGGDECPKDRWSSCTKCQDRIRAHGLKDEHELQSWVVQRMERHLSKRGKRLIGWDEILEGGLAPNATVMSWRGVKGGVAAAVSGHDVVMSPTTHCYFDYYQAREGEPKAIGGFLPLEQVYSFDPMTTQIPVSRRHHVLGGQANVWTEYMPNARQLQYMIAPRICALAESVWTPPKRKDWADFRRRLEVQEKRFDAAGFHYRPLKPEN